jgi:transposase
MSTAKPTAGTAPPATPITLPDDPALLKDIIQQLLALNAKLQNQVDGLQQQVEQLRRRLSGHKSERYDPNQPLLFPEMAQPDAVAPAPAPAPTVAADADAATKKRKGHGRGQLNPKLRRERHVHELPEEQRQCPRCHTTCAQFGEEVSEQLDYIPASLFVHQHVRCKYACPQCHDHVVVAGQPLQPITKGLPGAGLLAQVIVSKYADHLPLHRLERIFARQGVELARATMCDWMQSCAALLKPLYDRMVTRVLLSQVLHTDDTHVPHQDAAHPGQTTSARLWVYVGDQAHPYHVFDFTLTWSRDGPRQFLTENPSGKFQGTLQADALSGYDTLCADHAIARGGCWAHARRYFFEARDADPARAAEVLARIRRLYAVEEEIKEQSAKDMLPGAAAEALCLRLRQEKAVPEVTSLCHWLKEQQPQVLPKSPMGHAITYTLGQWDALMLYTHCAGLDIDNNVAERALRAIAVGRNNWLFVGSATGGHTAAILFTFTSTCRRLNLDPFAYLRAVLTRLAAGPLADDELDQLLPDRWTPPPAEPASNR